MHTIYFSIPSNGVFDAVQRPIKFRTNTSQEKCYFDSKWVLLEPDGTYKLQIPFSLWFIYAACAADVNESILYAQLFCLEHLLLQLPAGKGKGKDWV